MSEWNIVPTKARVLYFTTNETQEGDLPRLKGCFEDVTLVYVDDTHLGFVIDRTYRWHDLTVTTTMEFLNRP